MPTIDQYDISHNYIRAIVQGPPKSGKTCLACQFPRPHIIDVDVNLGGPLRFLRAHNLALPVSFDVIDKDEKGNPILDRTSTKKDAAMTPTGRYQQLERVLLAAQTNTEIDTIVIDSATTLSDVFIAEVLRQQGKTQMDKQMWGFFLMLGKHFMGTLTQMRKHVILLAHEKTKTDAAGNVVLPYEINWPGQLGQIMGAFFTDVWRCEVTSAPGTTPGRTNYKYVLRTMPNYQYKLGNSLELPDIWEFSWNEIQKKLAA
jgi:hypothetical protein